MIIVTEFHSLIVCPCWILIFCSSKFNTLYKIFNNFWVKFWGEIQNRFIGASDFKSEHTAIAGYVWGSLNHHIETYYELVYLCCDYDTSNNLNAKVSLWTKRLRNDIVVLVKQGTGLAILYQVYIVIGADHSFQG